MGTGWAAAAAQTRSSARRRTINELEHSARTGLALVAGGSGGLGHAICQTLARDGFDIALTYFSNAASAKSAAAGVEKEERHASVHQLDLVDSEATAALVNDLGVVDSVIYAAGPVIAMRYANQIAPATFAAQLGRDAAAAFNLLHAAIPKLRESRGTAVCLVTTALRRYSTRDLLSSAPKAAVEQVARAVAAEEGKFGVRANCVGVGVVEAGMWDGLRSSGDYDDRTLEVAVRNSALRRFGAAGEIAEVVAFLASTRSSYVTGQTIVADGGYAI
jgi:3-oxoacyl-[acyl-carrier protein] reductase